jgi:urease accessory protein UreF
MEISGAPDQTYVRLALSEEAVRVAQDTGNPELGVWAHGCRLGASWELGLRGQADSELAVLAAAVERVKEPLARWRLEVARGTLALIDGRYSGAVDAAERAAAVERRAGQHLAAGVARVIRHLAAARTGDTDTEDERRSLATADLRMWYASHVADQGRISEVRDIWPGGAEAAPPGVVTDQPSFWPRVTSWSSRHSSHLKHTTSSVQPR